MILYFETLKEQMKYYIEQIDQSGSKMTIEIQRRLFDS
jgi:hypothetical protein